MQGYTCRICASYMFVCVPSTLWCAFGPWGVTASIASIRVLFLLLRQVRQWSDEMGAGTSIPTVVESPVRRPISGGTKRPYCPIKNYFPATKRTLREAPRFFGTTMGFPRKRNQLLP